MQSLLGVPNSYACASLQGGGGDKRKTVAEQRIVVVFACGSATPISTVQRKACNLGSRQFQKTECFARTSRDHSR